VPLTAAQIQTKIDAVDAAITAAETAQSAGSRGTSISRANLATLYKRRDDLQAMLDRAEAVADGRNGMFARTRVKDIGDV
jgi:multidrug resistance efflux pump